MNPDAYPLDYTGHGPTGNGNAPTAREMRAQAMNRHRTDRMSGAMQFIDPYAVAASGTALRTLVGAGNTPDEARRSLFQSAGGQGALDAAMAARRGGFLGQGDPVNYARNISSGIAGGGFQTSFGGTMDGRSVYGNGRVSGQGAISERVSMNFAKGMLTDLYGSGMPDPGKLNGFDMEEASGVFSKLARRGVIGQVAHVERNADMNTRIAAARDGAVDPSIRAGLAGVQVSGQSAAQDTEELNKLIEATDDPKLKREMTKIRDSTDAVVVNDQERQRVSKMVRSITEGMASLADIYGELSCDELHQKLEEVSGMRITNSSQARKATEMVNQMRGAANISGMDPRAFADYSGEMQGLLQGDVMRAGGFDERTASQSKRVTAVMHTQMMTDAAISSKLASQTVQRAREQGIDVADAPTLDEIYEDKRQGRTEFLEKYKSVAMTQGGLDNFSGDQRKRAEALLNEFKDTENIADPNDQAQARALISSQLKGEWATLYGGDFAAAEASRTGQVATSNAYDDPKNAREMERMAMIGRRNAINVNPVVGMLDEMGAGGGIEQAQQLRDSLGLQGMTDMIRDSRGDDPASVRKQKQQNILKQAGIEGAAADDFSERFFDEDGRLKDEAGFQKAATFIGQSGWEGGMANYDQAHIGEERMAAVGADSNRVRLRGEDQSVSLNSIATSLLTGNMTGVSDPESMALMLQAMADTPGATMPSFGAVDAAGNPIMKSAADSFATGIDFSGGLNKEGLGKLSKLHGKDLDLHTKMGYDSMEELIAASEADSNITADALSMLRTDEDYTGLNLSGDQYNVTALTDEAKEGFLKTGELDAHARKIGGAMLINRSLGLTDEESSNMMSADGSFDSSRFAADEFGGIEGKWLAKGPRRAEMGGGLGRVLNLSGLVDTAGEDGMKAISALDEDDALSQRLQDQYDELAKAKTAGGKDGGNMLVEYKGEGGKDESTTVDAAMKSIEAAMEKLAEATAATKGAQIIEEMTVTNIRVENMKTTD